VVVRVGLVLDEAQQLRLRSHALSRQNHAGVGLVAVGCDDCVGGGGRHRLQRPDILRVALYHLHPVGRQTLDRVAVRLDDDVGVATALQFGYQRVDGRGERTDDHVAVAVELPGRAGRQRLREQRQHERRQREEDERDAGELHHDHERQHRGRLPLLSLLTVADSGERLDDDV